MSSLTGSSEGVKIKKSYDYGKLVGGGWGAAHAATHSFYFYECGMWSVSMVPEGMLTAEGVCAGER